MCYDSNVSIMKGSLIDKKEKDSYESGKQPLLVSDIKIVTRVVIQKL